jgi:predicted transporter
MIFGYGLYELGTGIMAVQNYHASVWWGALMLLVGLFYLIRFRPSRTN